MPKRFAGFRLLLFFLAIPLPRLTAQEVFVQGPAKLLTRFSFTQLTGGIIIVRASIDDKTDSLNFILDTGSGGISLDSVTVSEIGLPITPSNRTIRGIAGIRTVNFANNHTLRLPGLSVDSLNFHINDYGLLSQVYGVRIDGIIGFSFLRKFIVLLDYDSLAIEVYKPGLYKYKRGGHLLKPTISGLPIQNAVVREEEQNELRFYLDTGAGLCLLLSQEYCEDSALFSPKKKRYRTVTEGLGGKKEMEMIVLKEFKLGPYKFKKIPTYIFEDEFNVLSYPSLSGLIGNDLLRRFNVVLNYGRSEIHLLPNSHFRDAFDYSYSGLGIYVVGNDIMIMDVIKNSPADFAGLKEGDIIVSIDNNFTGNIQAYKSLLQVPGTTAKLIIKRGAELFETRISIKSIKR